MLALAPSALLRFSRGGSVNSDAILLPFFPVSSVLATVRPEECALAIFLIIDVFALVSPPVGPVKDAEALHLVIFPPTLVDAGVAPSVDAVAIDVVLVEFALIGAPVRPRDLALSMFFPIHVVSFVGGTVGPGLDAVAVLLILLPVAHVAGAVAVGVDAETVGLVVLPETVVDVSVGVDEPTIAINLVFLPLSLVHRAIRPYLNTLALPNTGPEQPLALVLSAIFKQGHLAVLEQSYVCRVRPVIKVPQLISYLNHDRVVVVELVFAIHASEVGHLRDLFLRLIHALLRSFVITAAQNTSQRFIVLSLYPCYLFSLLLYFFLQLLILFLKNGELALLALMGI